CFFFFFSYYPHHLDLHSFPTRRSSDLMKFRELKLRKNPDCVVCGKNPSVTKLIDYEEFCGLRGQEKPVSTNSFEISVEELKRVGDRKSTRLNSSHSQISYAVFCLKKKK